MHGRNMRAALGLVSVVLLVAGCSSIEGQRLIDPARAPAARFFVEHQPKDGRHLEVKIGESLQAHGVTVTTKREEADYVVTYVDRWAWDMRMFLRAHTNFVVGSGRSRQDSLAAMGKSHRDVIDRAVSAMFEGK